MSHQILAWMLVPQKDDFKHLFPSGYMFSEYIFVLGRFNDLADMHATVEQARKADPRFYWVTRHQKISTCPLEEGK